MYNKYTDQYTDYLCINSVLCWSHIRFVVKLICVRKKEIRTDNTKKYEKISVKVFRDVKLIQLMLKITQKAINMFERPTANENLIYLLI